MKTALSIAFACSLAALAAGPFVIDKTDPAAAGMNAARLARIPVRMKEFVTAGKTAGVVTLVARHGHVASLEAVGYQNLEDKTPMRTDTIFRLASVTKPVTCAGVMILVDEGRVSLIDPVEKYLPEFKGLKLNPCGTRAGYNCALVTPSRPVNILDLMTHTSGLPGAVPGREGAAQHAGRERRRRFPRQPAVRTGHGMELQQYRHRRARPHYRGGGRPALRPLPGRENLPAARHERYLLLHSAGQSQPPGLGLHL